MSIMFYTHPCQIRRKREIIHKELSDLFPQLAQTWKNWGCNAYNDEMPWKSLHWRHNERKGVSNHQRLHFLLNCWSRRGSKKTSKLRVTDFCVGNSPVTGEFPAQKASNAEMFQLDDVILISCTWPSEWNRSIYQIHYTGVTLALWRLEPLVTLLIVQQLLRVNK